MNRTGLTDLALAPLAGLRTGTTLMEPVGAKRYQLQSQADGEREDAVRPGAPYALAADKTADLLGVNHPAVLRRRTNPGTRGGEAGNRGGDVADRRRHDDARPGLQRPQPRLPAVHARSGLGRSPRLRLRRRRDHRARLEAARATPVTR